MFQIKKYFILCLLLFLPSSFLYAQTLPAPSSGLTSEIERQALQGRDLIFHRKYPEAQDLFTRLSQEESTALLGSFGLMAIWQSKMFENFDFRYDPQFQAVSEQNKQWVEKIANDPNASAWDLFIAGASSGLRSFYLMRKDAPFKALAEGNRSQKLLTQALKKDPNLKDIYLGLGMYDYWRSVFTNRIKILPFFSDKRSQGLAEIERSIQEGKIVGALAQVSLAFCYYEQQDAAKAIPVLEKILKNYPENVIVKNLLGDLYAVRGSYAQAHQIFDELISHHPEIGVAKFYKANAYHREGNLAEARKWYEAFLQIHPAPAWAAYALTDLGRIDLAEHKENEAYEKFKKAYRTYSDYPVPLRELNKLRQKRW